MLNILKKAKKKRLMHEQDTQAHVRCPSKEMKEFEHTREKINYKQKIKDDKKNLKKNLIQ